MSDFQLDQLYDDVEVRHEVKLNIQVSLPQVSQARLQEFPQVPQLQLAEAFKVLPLPVPNAPQVGLLQVPQVSKPDVIPKAATTKAGHAPLLTHRDRAALKPAVRFEDEFDGLGSKHTTKKP